MPTRGTPQRARTTGAHSTRARKPTVSRAGRGPASSSASHTDSAAATCPTSVRAVTSGSVASAVGARHAAPRTVASTRRAAGEPAPGRPVRTSHASTAVAQSTTVG